MSGAGFFRLKKLTGNGIIGKAARHNKRWIQAEFGASKPIDPARSHLNIRLLGPTTPDEVAALAKAKLVQAGITKPRKNAVLGIELLFSLPTNHRCDIVQYFTSCADWVGTEFGGADNILSLDIHRDEAQDHAHILLVPLIDGRLNGSDAVGNARKLSGLQTKFFQTVASCFGFSKPRTKLTGKRKEQAIKQVLSKLRNDPAGKSAAWAVIRDSVESDPQPYAIALGIEIPDSLEKRSKTSTQIFTSKGKGPKKENPNRELAKLKRQTLGHCRVSIPAPSLETVRLRDCELKAEHFDHETGEFHMPTKGPPKGRLEADKWVRKALGTLRAKELK